jgi:rRNA maturation endonuclease Nob1
MRTDYKIYSQYCPGCDKSLISLKHKCPYCGTKVMKHKLKRLNTEQILSKYE